MIQDHRLGDRFCFYRATLFALIDVILVSAGRMVY